MSPSKGWANVFERMPTAIDILWLGHLPNERERLDIKRKCVNTDKAQWNEPELTTLISEVGDGTNIRSKEAHALPYQS